MFMERFSDYFLTFHAWKCINCATVVDQTILSNKTQAPEFTSAIEVAPVKVQGQ
jgi:hypothetical protein